MITPDYVPRLKMQKAGELCENTAGATVCHRGTASIWEHLHPLDLVGATLGLDEGFASVLLFPGMPNTLQNDPKHKQLGSGQ